MYEHIHTYDPIVASLLAFAWDIFKYRDCNAYSLIYFMKSHNFFPFILFVYFILFFGLSTGK